MILINKLLIYLINIKNKKKLSNESVDVCLQKCCHFSPKKTNFEIFDAYKIKLTIDYPYFSMNNYCPHSKDLHEG